MGLMTEKSYLLLFSLTDLERMQSAWLTEYFISNLIISLLMYLQRKTSLEK